MAVGLRFMTWNIDYGQRDDHLERVAALIRGTGVDIAILQEIAVSGSLAGGVNQVTQLSADTGLFNRVFAKDGGYGGGDVGIAVLSRFPLGQVQAITYGLDAAPATTGGKPPCSGSRPPSTGSPTTSSRRTPAPTTTSAPAQVWSTTWSRDCRRVTLSCSAPT